MPVLYAVATLPDEAVVSMVKDKMLSTWDSPIHRDLARQLLAECLSKGHIKFETLRDPKSYQTIVRATLAVGKEHVVTHKLEVGEL